MAVINSVTLGGKVVYDPPDDYLLPINFFEFHGGGSAYGYGLFCMTSDDFDAMNQASNNTPVILKMSSSDNPDEGISIYVVIGGAEVIGTTLQSAVTDMVAVVVFDMRKWLFEPNSGSSSSGGSGGGSSNAAFNVQVPRLNFKTSATPPTVYLQVETTNAGEPYEWADMLKFKLGLSALPVEPTWKPRNCIWNGVPKNRIMDDIARQLFLLVGFDPDSTVEQTIQKTLTFCVPGDMGGPNTYFKSAAESSLLFDTDGIKNTDLIPGTFKVNFIVYDNDNQANVYKNSFYTKSVSTGSSGNKIQALDVGSYIGFYSRGKIVNKAELDTVATDLAARATVYMRQHPSTITYAGAWQFCCDGAIRGVRWSSNQDGCTTLIRINDEQFWSPVLDMYRRMEIISNQLVVGIGATQVSSGPNGTRYVIAVPHPMFTFKITGYDSSGGSGSSGGGQGGTGGGGQYFVKMFKGYPDGSQSVKDDLNLPDTGEALGTDLYIWENDAESDLHPTTHLLSIGTFVEGKYVGIKKDVNGHDIDVYRGAMTPNILRRLKIITPVGSQYGSGQYQAKVFSGIADGTQLVSAAFTAPDAGENLGSRIVCWENDFESGLTASHLLPVGTIVEGVYAGQKKDAGGTEIIVYRGFANGSPFQYGKVTALWTAAGDTITLQPCDSGGASLPGTSPINVSPEFPGPAQYCGYAINDVTAYVTLPGGGTHVLLHNKLPKMTGQYQGWFNNASSGNPNVVADYVRMK